MSYIKIDFNEVKGYSRLSEEAKELFEYTYKRHNSIQGTDYKTDWLPIEVKECKDHLRVIFKNGQWLHYTSNKDWF